MEALRIGEDGRCPHCGADLSLTGAVACADILAMVVPGTYVDGHVVLDLAKRGNPSLRDGEGRDVYCVKCSKDLDVYVVPGRP